MLDGTMEGKMQSVVQVLHYFYFCYLGRGWTFDDLYEVTRISDEVQQVFFHTFIDYGSTMLYKKHVIDCMNTNIHTSD